MTSGDRAALTQEANRMALAFSLVKDGTAVPVAALEAGVPAWELRRVLAKEGVVLPPVPSDRLAFVNAMGRLGIRAEKAWAWANEIPAPMVIAAHQVEAALDGELQRVRSARRVLASAPPGDHGVAPGGGADAGAGGLEHQRPQPGVGEPEPEVAAAVPELPARQDGP